MKSIAIDCEVGDEIEALRATAKSIREGYGAGTLIKVDADYYHQPSDNIGFWTSIPTSWEPKEIHILIESEKDLLDYEMAALVESKILNY